MADEDTIESSILEEGMDFAQMITGDNTPDDTPPPEEVKPDAAETKPEEKPAPAAEEDENPFKTDDTEKPAPAAPEEEPEPDKPSSKDDWNRLRESRNRYKAEAAERDALLREKEAETTELKAKAARAAELEEKVRLFDEQEKELALARVESTIEYKETIDEPLKAVVGEVRVLVKSNEGDMTEVEKMLIESDPAKQRAMLKEITSGWDEIDRIDLKKMTEDARILLDKQDKMRANAHATAKEQKELAAQRDAEAKDAVRKEYAKATTEVVKSVREKVPFTPLVEGETEDDRYSVLSQKVAQVDFDAQTPRAKALAVASTFALPQAIKTIGLRDAEIATLKQALAKAAKGGASIATKADETPDAEDKDFFKEFGISDRSAMFGSMSLDVTA